MSNHHPVFPVNIDEILRDLPMYLQRVENNGVTLLIMKAGKPIAEIKPVISSAKVLRPFSGGPRDVTILDEFDEASSEQMMSEY